MISNCLTLIIVPCNSFLSVPFEHVALRAKGITKIDFFFKKFIYRSTSDSIEKQSHIIVTREVHTKPA